jgi:hypothetical protein
VYLLTDFRNRISAFCNLCMSLFSLSSIRIHIAS